MPPDENLNSIENESQADELLEQIERPSHEPIQDEKPQPPPQTVDEFELTVGGKQIKAKRDQLIQWAQQGYSAPGKLSQLSRELETWKKKFSETEPEVKRLRETYGPVDEYVKQNPQFWDHVVQSYQNKNQLLNDQSNPIAQEVQSLRQTVQDLIQYKNQMEDERQKQLAAQDDQNYMQTFEETKKAYPDIDFDTPDEEGKSLEYKILEHAQNEGIKNFKTAFRDFYHDELIKREAGKAKESVLKEKQKNTKLGILGITPMPTKKVSSDHRGKSYDDLAAEALREYNIS